MNEVRIRILAAAMLLLGAGVAQATTGEINLNRDALRIDWSAPLDGLNTNVDALYDVGLLLGEQDDSRYTQAHLGALVTGDAGARDANITAGLGARVLVLDGEGFTGEALALGGQVEARVPSFNRLGMFAYAYGAPKASSFGDFDGHVEYAVAIDYAVLRQASLYVGFRQVRVDVDNAGTFTVDTGWHAGLRLTF